MWTGWHANGEKKYQGNYVDGKPDDLYKELDDQGRLIKSIKYDEGLVLTEYHVQRDESGTTEYHKRNGVLDGQWTRWYKNGNKAEEGKYKDGKRSGEWNGWYRSSKKNFSCAYEDGKRAGNYVEWNSKGKNS